MTRHKYSFLLFFMLLAGIAVHAQDTHFSQYNYAPLQLNPALAGLNNCDYRLALNGRTQWNTLSTTGNTYSTFQASADFAIGKITRINSFAGIGVSLMSDISGATSLNVNRGDVTFAYHFMLDKRGNGSISAGIQVGVNERRIDASKITTDQQYNTATGGYDNTIPTGENFARTNMLYIDAGVGALYSQYFKKQRHNFYFGVAVNHVNQPNISWNSTGLFNNSAGDDKLYAKVTLHGGGSFQIGGKTWILPSYMLLFQGPSQQYNFGSLLRFKLGNAMTQNYFAFGAQFRAPLDAFILQARFDYKGLMLGLSYDINVSKLLPGTQSYGAPELAVIFTGCSKKKPHPFLCPVL